MDGGLIKSMGYVMGWENGNAPCMVRIVSAAEQILLIKQ